MVNFKTNHNLPYLKKLVNLSILALLSFSMTACYTLSTHQSAKTLGKGNDEFRYSAALISAPNVLEGPEASEGYYKDSTSISLVQMQYMRGFTDQLDLGFTAGIEKFGLLAKYQFYGDQESIFAMAAGLNINAAITSSLINGGVFGIPSFKIASGFELPLYLSLHPTKNIAIYSNPTLFYLNPIKDSPARNRELAFYYDGYYKGLSSGAQFTIPWMAPSEHSTFSLSLEFNWGSPLNGNDYIFSGGLGVIFRGFNY